MLTLYYHPLASYCWKVLVALYESNVTFTPHLVDLGDPAEREALRRLWPLTKFPVIQDEARGETVAESSIIIEYLTHHHPRARALLPQDASQALKVRKWDRFFDRYLHDTLQEIVGDMLRPEGKHDPFGVAQAHATIATALGMLEAHMGEREWAAGDAFSMADCAAAPPLYYLAWMGEVKPEHAQVSAYLARLKTRPSFSRVLEEAKPYFHMFPGAKT